MYAEAQMNKTAGMIAGASQISHRNTTVAENIDSRVVSLQEQIERLQAVKAKLTTGSILDLSLEDLQMAMGRY